MKNNKSLHTELDYADKVDFKQFLQNKNFVSSDMKIMNQTFSLKNRANWSPDKNPMRNTTANISDFKLN